MEFSRYDGVIRVVHITGPMHNLLGLDFRTGDGALDVEELAASGARHLRASDVLREVLAGVEDGNRELGTSFTPCRMQFVPSDSGPVSIYRSLAHELTRRHASEATKAGGTPASHRRGRDEHIVSHARRSALR